MLVTGVQQRDSVLYKQIDLGVCAQSHPTLCNPLDCSPPGFSCPWDSPGKSTRVNCHFLLQGIFPTQGSKLGLLHSKQILNLLCHQGSPCVCECVCVCVCVCALLIKYGITCLIFFCLTFTHSSFWSPATHMLDHLTFFHGSLRFYSTFLIFFFLFSKLENLC